MLDLDNDKTVIEIVDQRLGPQPLEIEVRKPTSRELFMYSANKVARKGKRVELRAHEVRQEYGLAVIQGFAEHPELRASGEPISCDPDSPGYRKDWLELLAREPAWIDIVAQTMFESAREKIEIDPDLEFVVAGEDEDSGQKTEDRKEETEDKKDDPGLVEELDAPLGS